MTEHLSYAETPPEFREGQSYLCPDGWDGRSLVPVVIIKETPKRYRIELLSDCLMPSRRFRKRGSVMYVPKYAIQHDKGQV